MLREVDKYVQWDAARGVPVPQLWRRQILPSWLYFDLSDVDGALTIPAAGTATPLVSYKQPYSSLEGLDRGQGTPFEVRDIVFADSTDTTVAADFTVVLKEMGEVRDFMNGPIHIRTIAGTAQQPGLLVEPYFMLSQHNLQAQFAKVAGGATTARMYLRGAQYYPWAPSFLRHRADYAKIEARIRKWMNRRKFVTPFWLTTEITPVIIPAVIGSTFEATAKIGVDGPLEIFGWNAVSTGTFTVSMSDAKTHQTIMNGQVSDVNGLGSARFPVKFVEPYLLPPGMRLSFRFTNRIAGENTVFLTLFGRKIYAPIKEISGIRRRFPVVPTPADTPSRLVPTPFM